MSMENHQPKEADINAAASILYATSSLVMTLTIAGCSFFVCALAAASINKPRAQRRHVLDILDRLVDLISRLREPTLRE